MRRFYLNHSLPSQTLRPFCADTDQTPERLNPGSEGTIKPFHIRSFLPLAVFEACVCWIFDFRRWHRRPQCHRSCTERNDSTRQWPNTERQAGYRPHATALIDARDSSVLYPCAIALSQLPLIRWITSNCPSACQDVPRCIDFKVIFQKLSRPVYWIWITTPLRPLSSFRNLSLPPVHAS